MVGDLCQARWEEVQTPCQGPVVSSWQGQIKLGLPTLAVLALRPGRS